jgi:hypothetical protein
LLLTASLRRTCPSSSCRSACPVRAWREAQHRTPEEHALIALAGLPADLAADRLHHLALRARVVVTQHTFEDLQFVFAIDRQLGLAKAIGGRGACGRDRHRAHQLAPLGLDYPGSGDEVASAQVVAIEEREQHEDRQPDRRGNPGDAGLEAAGSQERDRNEHLHIAHEVSRDHRLRGQPAPATGPARARGDANAHRALARRRPARA